jgi:hypothetical protein
MVSRKKSASFFFELAKLRIQRIDGGGEILNLHGIHTVCLYVARHVVLWILDFGQVGQSDSRKSTTMAFHFSSVITKSKQYKKTD